MPITEHTHDFHRAHELTSGPIYLFQWLFETWGEAARASFLHVSHQVQLRMLKDMGDWHWQGASGRVCLGALPAPAGQGQGSRMQQSAMARLQQLSQPASQPASYAVLAVPFVSSLAELPGIQQQHVPATDISAFISSQRAPLYIYSYRHLQQCWRGADKRPAPLLPRSHPPPVCCQMLFFYLMLVGGFLSLYLVMTNTHK
jgi:hypothetical protein